MSAVVIATAFGGPDVLEIANQPPGEPGPDEALIEIRAAGVNPVDYKAYSGAFGADPARLPLRLGSEASGVVTAAGPGAVGPAGPIEVGAEVIAFRAPGAYAAELVVPASALVPKPDTLDWAQASGLMLTGVTAWHLLEATGVGAGDTVLIHGGAGGVGTMAVQLAVIRGATVVATADPKNHEFLHDLGAIPVEYGTGLMDRARAAAPGGVDAALDLAGTDEALDVSFVLVPDRTRIATIVSFERGLNTGIKVLGGAPGADPGTEIRDAARLQLARLAQEGTLRVFVSHTFSLAEAAEAHRVIMEGHTQGKIALIP
jgi:NADPH:quinone reductase-like Zn-dependent oxidoreductase